MVKGILDISIGMNITQIFVPLIMQYCNHFSCPPLLEVLGIPFMLLQGTHFPLEWGCLPESSNLYYGCLACRVKRLKGSSIRDIQPCALDFPPQFTSGNTLRIVDYLHEGWLQKLIFSLVTEVVLWKNVVFLQILHMNANSLQHHCFFVAHFIAKKSVYQNLTLFTAF